MFLRIVLSLVCLGYGVPVVSARAAMTVLNPSPKAHKARAANFGAPMRPGLTNYANLMLPPSESDPYLCQEPDLELLNSQASLPEYEVALFVSRGECSFERKARNAAKLQKNSTVRYVIVYNNDPDNRQSILVMSAASPEEVLWDLNRLSLLFVGTGTGDTVREQIADHASRTQKSPYFLGANSTGWDMPILLEKLPPEPEQKPTGYPYGSSNQSGRGSSRGENMFYWLRFVLFALLIVAPCLRAIYLWWGGGGRILLRRNEEGRITGLQYVSPMRYWFAGGAAGSANAENPVSDRLTKEQFLALPVIEYRSPETDDSESVSEEAPESNEAQPPQEVTDLPTSQEDNLENTEGGYRLSASCTTCSICIDDFEDGERLCLLPRCGHGFHPDCILPWLTERQGCCPLCKTSVLGGTSEADTDVEASFETSPSEAETSFPENGLEGNPGSETDRNVVESSEPTHSDHLADNTSNDTDAHVESSIETSSPDAEAFAPDTETSAPEVSPTSST